LLHCPMEEGFCITKTTGSSSPSVEGHALYWRECFFNLLREASSQVDAGSYCFFSFQKRGRSSAIH
jgi:hypothetical protein